MTSPVDGGEKSAGEVELRKGRPFRQSTPPWLAVEMGLALVEPLIGTARSMLNADAVTVAVRCGGEERLLVCTEDDAVRNVSGSLSLGLVSNGPTKLSGGAGLLQAVESAALFGFTPAGYLGVRFDKRGYPISGGIAAWSRRARRWDAADSDIVRQIAKLFEAEFDAAAAAAA